MTAGQMAQQSHIGQHCQHNRYPETFGIYIGRGCGDREFYIWQPEAIPGLVPIAGQNVDGTYNTAVGTEDTGQDVTGGNNTAVG